MFLAKITTGLFLKLEGGLLIETGDSNTRCQNYNKIIEKDEEMKKSHSDKKSLLEN